MPWLSLSLAQRLPASTKKQLSILPKLLLLVSFRPGDCWKRSLSTQAPNPKLAPANAQWRLKYVEEQRESAIQQKLRAYEAADAK